MASKKIVAFLFLLLAVVLFASSQVAASRDLAEEVEKSTNTEPDQFGGGYRGGRYGGGRGGYGGRCRYGRCCGRYGRCRCCHYAGEKIVDAEPQAEPKN